MSKTCQETIELMNLYLDGRLSGGQYQELAKHLEGCEHCRKRMNYLRVITSELRQDRPTMPDDLHSSIMDHIAKATAPAEPRRLPFKKLRKTLALCAAALVLVLVAPIALSSMQLPDTSTDSSFNTNSDAGKVSEVGYNGGNWFKNLFQNILQSLSGSKTEDKPTVDKDPDSSQSGSTPGQNNTDQNGSSGSGSGDPSGSTDSNQANNTGSSGKTENAYTVPALHTKEKFANYIVATGTVVGLEQYFDLKNVAVYPQDGSVYVHLSNNAASSAQAYYCIRMMGLTLQLSPEGLPKTDASAPEILFVIFPQ